MTKHAMELCSYSKSYKVAPADPLLLLDESNCISRVLSCMADNIGDTSEHAGMLLSISQCWQQSPWVTNVTILVDTVLAMNHRSVLLMGLHGGLS